MLEVQMGVNREEAEKLFTSQEVNKTYRRRLGSGTALRKLYEDAFSDRASSYDPTPSTSGASGEKLGLPPIPVEEATGEEHAEFMRVAIEAARNAAKQGSSKER